MLTLPKKAIITLSLALTPFIFASSALAAAPDGSGPWADSVLSSSQGLMKNGSPVPAIRSDSSSALGVAENDTVEGHFYSLGFGGKISLGFDNGISSGVILVEATNVGYPNETVKVEVSENGLTWVNAGNVSADGSVNKPQGISCAKYVRLTDVSDPNNFSDATADGYDVDGVKASGEPCTPVTPTPTPGCCGTCSSTDIKQTNNNAVINATTVVQNTGGNKAKDNNGAGNVKVNSGPATAGVSNATTTGGNTATVTGECCEGGTTVTIEGNGKGSTNTVNIGKADKKVKEAKVEKAPKKAK